MNDVQAVWLYGQWALKNHEVPKLVAPLVCALLVLGFVTARAEEPASDESQAIKVERVRDPAMVPYRKGYEMARRVQEAAGGRVRLLFRALSARSKQPIDGLQITIEGTESHGALEISPDGFFSIPLDEAAVRDDAEFVTNQKRGSVLLTVVLEPQLPREGLRYSMIVDCMQGARRTLREIVPWYFRLFTPHVRGIGICYRQPGGRVDITGNGAGYRQADKVDTDDLDRTVYCARFTDDEKALTSDSLIIPSAGWEPVFLDR